MSKVKIQKASTTLKSPKLGRDQKSQSSKDFCVLDCFLDNRKGSLSKLDQNAVNSLSTQSQANLLKTSIPTNNRQRDSKHKQTLKDKTKNEIS